jgi:hypothetical protein
LNLYTLRDTDLGENGDADTQSTPDSFFPYSHFNLPQYQHAQMAYAQASQASVNVTRALLSGLPTFTAAILSGVMPADVLGFSLVAPFGSCMLCRPPISPTSVMCNKCTSRTQATWPQFSGAVWANLDILQIQYFLFNAFPIDSSKVVFLVDQNTKYLV